MRHFNSPDERAKREATDADGEKPQHRGFMHYNHPDQIAKREREGKAATAVVAPKRQPRASAAALPADWPPAGEDNTASVIVAPGGVAPPRRRRAPLTDLPAAERLEQLETLVYSFLDDVTQAREFRMLLSNQAAVTETQQGIADRVRALEATLEDLRDQLEEFAGDLDAEAAADPDSRRTRDTEPPPQLLGKPGMQSGEAFDDDAPGGPAEASAGVSVVTPPKEST
jgi:hypothetical protein